ncbi:MAG: ATP-binding protein [Sulfurimicrobium sp.]
MLDTVDLSIQKMKRLLQKLSSGPSIEKPAPLVIDQLLQQAVAAKSAVEPRPVLEILEPGQVVMANWARLERVIGHLIQNAVEAVPRDGQVRVCLSRASDAAIIEIKDTGHGMSEAFIRERLFKPFESTKSAGMGVGVFESREYVHELGGQLEVSSEPSIGTTFRMSLPLYNQNHAIEKAA